MSIIRVLLAAAGYLAPVAGAVAQEVIDVAAVLNAFRVVLPSGELTFDSSAYLSLLRFRCSCSTEMLVQV